MTRFVVTLFCVYYFFSIIGMESFSGLLSKCGCVMRNGSGMVQCEDELFQNNTAYTFVIDESHTECNPAEQNCSLLPCDSVPGCNVVKCGRYYGDYYNRSSADGLYYLNNFDNLLRSYVTLFELMVVNNWHVTMQGTVDAVRYFRPSSPEQLSRAYYIIFFLVTVIIVTNVVVAFILDAFQSILPLMKKRYNLKNIDEDPLEIDININKDEFDSLMEGRKPKKIKVKDPNQGGTYRLLGRRPITTLEVHSSLFADGMREWDDKETADAGKRRRDPKKWVLTPGVITGTTDSEATEVKDNQYEPPSVQASIKSGNLDQPNV
jgi:hypothetical protein